MIPKVFLFFLPLLRIQVNSFTKELAEKYEDGFLSTTDILKKYSYVYEEHYIDSNDYILTVYRILPNKRKCNEMDFKKTPLMLLHGIEASGGSFVGIDPFNALALRLSDECYDVWLINFRGTEDSLQHKFLSASSPQYWDFALDELGTEDTIHFIKYVSAATNTTKSIVICFSVGCAPFFIAASREPETTEKHVLATVGFSPLTFLGNVESKLIRQVFTLLDTMPGLENLIGYRRFPPALAETKLFYQIVCADELRIPQQFLCIDLLYAIFGKNPPQVNSTKIEILVGHFLVGTSTKHFYHLAQLSQSNRFRSYDYGENENYKRYGSSTPPDYPLERVNIPVAFYHSDKDILSTRKDYEKLVRRLPNVVAQLRGPWDDWNHSDFLFGSDAPTLFFPSLIELLPKF